MHEYSIPTEAIWLSLTRDERARKVAYIMASNLMSNIQSYEATHK